MKQASTNNQREAQRGISAAYTALYEAAMRKRAELAAQEEQTAVNGREGVVDDNRR